MRGIEPRAFHMQSERSTTELQPLNLSDLSAANLFITTSLSLNS